MQHITFFDDLGNAIFQSSPKSKFKNRYSAKKVNFHLVIVVYSSFRARSFGIDPE